MTARVAVSIAWFVPALAAVIATEITYGWRSVPVAHWQSALAWLGLMSWLYAGRWLHSLGRIRNKPPKVSQRVI